MAQSLTQDFIQRRVDRGVATGSGAHLDSRLNNSAWDANANGASPFTATPGEEITEFGTSLSQVGSWMTKTDAEKIKAAKELLAKGQKLPVPAKIDRRVDMWTQTRVTNISPANDISGDAYTSYVGADYKPIDGIVMGGMVQFDAADTTSAPLGGSADGRGYTAGPYMAMQLSPHITLDAKAAWGEARDSVVAGSAATSFQTSRSLTNARLKGDWMLNDWRLTPTAAIESINETATLGLGDASAQAGFSRMSVGPKISRQFNIGNDKSIEPFVHMNSNVDLEQTGFFNSNSLDALQAYNTVGAGFALSQTDEFTFSATADVDNPGDAADKALRTGVKLTIPLD